MGDQQTLLHIKGGVLILKVRSWNHTQSRLFEPQSQVMDPFFLLFFPG